MQPEALGVVRVGRGKWGARRWKKGSQGSRSGVGEEETSQRRRGTSAGASCEVCAEVTLRSHCTAAREAQ